MEIINEKKLSEDHLDCAKYMYNYYIGKIDGIY